MVPPEDVLIIGNTGDDEIFHGLHVSPDLDTVTYTLGGVVGPMGWGLADDTFHCLEALERAGAPVWFKLGDADLATHLVRTTRLREGATLSEATAEITRSFGLKSKLLPMTDDRVATRIETDGGLMAMQEWFVRERTEPAVLAVRFEGADTAAPAPGVLDALAEADGIFISPSNPVISIGPILALPGVREVLRARRDKVVGVSPIIHGAALKGPADRLMAATGLEVSCVGVAAAYADICATLLVDTVDADRAGDVAAAGIRPQVEPIIMKDIDGSVRLAQTVVDAL